MSNSSNEKAAWELLAGLGTEVCVIKSLLIALIETHPNREAAKDVFLRAASLQKSEVLDGAFEHSLPADLTEAHAALLDNSVHQWRLVFERQQNSKQEKG